MKTFRRRGKTAGIPLLFQSVSFISSCFLGAHGSYHLVWYGWKASSPCCGGHSCIGLKNLGVWRGFLGGLVVKNPSALPETQETWVQSLGWEDTLEEGMATYSSILTWRIPWTEERSRLQFIGLHRIRND